jgi:hypothetical protein
MGRIWQILIILAMAANAWSSQPLLNVPYNITAVDALTNGLFRLIGTTHDYSWLGYGASDIQTNDYVVIQSATYGDIDLYRISNIWSQADSLFICDVVYAEDGTPRAGQPEPGYQEISRDGYLYSTTFGGPSEYLQNGARNLFFHLLDDRVVELEKGIYAPGAIQVITNGGSVTASGVYVKICSGGGEVASLATPQITAGTNGQFLTIQGTNSSNTVTVTNGTDLALNEEVPFTFGSNAVMGLIYNDGVWVERHRDSKQ